MNPSKKADLQKLSHLVVTGSLVETINGGVYRVTSKIASQDGFDFKLADLQGKPVAVPANFKPVSHSLARFAAWMRFVVAYNQDFDMYVKEYIKAAGLPVDQEMNWAKFLYAVVAPKLISRDSEVVEEAIHQIIIKALAERRILDGKNPNGFRTAIKKFPPAVQKMPEEKQVTVFLEKAFSWRIAEANEYIKTYVYQENTDSMWSTENGEEDGTEVNLLDTVENGVGRSEYDLVEADADIAKFRKGFAKWVEKKFRAETAKDYLHVFDILYRELRSMGTRPSSSELMPYWRKSPSSLKARLAELPKLIDTYIKNHLNEMNYDVHPFLELMRSTAETQDAVKEKAKATHASLANLKTAGIEEATEEIDEAAKALEKNAAGQWETPKCEICSSMTELMDCSSCKKRLCGEHMLNHMQNNPSHDHYGLIASKK